jgi:hypothetical protein
MSVIEVWGNTQCYLSPSVRTPLSIFIPTREFWLWIFHGALSLGIELWATEAWVLQFLVSPDPNLNWLLNPDHGEHQRRLLCQLPLQGRP